jgi:hypothetical protein
MGKISTGFPPSTVVLAVKKGAVRPLKGVPRLITLRYGINEDANMESPTKDSKNTVTTLYSILTYMSSYILWFYWEAQKNI